MKKTIKDWLQELPSPWKEAALEQADKEDLLKEVGSMSGALEWFVAWDETKEGDSAWEELSEHYADLEAQLPPKYPQHLLKKEEETPDPLPQLDKLRVELFQIAVEFLNQENEALRKQIEELQKELEALKEQEGKPTHKYPLGYIDREEFKIVAQMYDHNGEPCYLGCFQDSSWDMYHERDVTPHEQSPSRNFPIPFINWIQEE